MDCWAISIVIAIAVSVGLYADVFASEEVLGVKPEKAELRVIDEKCLDCRNRRRIESAVKERKNIEMILQRMREKGGILTRREREVFGHFGRQEPFKPKK